MEAGTGTIRSLASGWATIGRVPSHRSGQPRPELSRTTLANWLVTEAAISHRRVGPLAVSETGTPTASPVPVVFLHGIGSSRLAFDTQLTHFASPAGGDRWCLAPDAPGYADSDDVPEIDSLDDYVDHIIGLLDAVGAERADLVGVSWGGVIAARMAANHSSRVRRLVLADTSRGSGVDPARAEAMRGRGEALEAKGPIDFAAARAPRLLSPDAPPELVDAVASEMAAAIRQPGYGQAARAMADTDHSELLGSIPVPTLVVVGEADIVCPPAEAEVLTATVPNASLVVIAAAGHLANREQPDAFNQAVGHFLATTETD